MIYYVRIDYPGEGVTPVVESFIVKGRVYYSPSVLNSRSHQLRIDLFIEDERGPQ